MKLKSSSNDLDCELCQSYLADYVHLELSSQEAQQAYPEVAFHIEVCEYCEAAYYREFRTQGQRKTLAELQQIGQRAQVEATMAQILKPPSQEPPSPPDPAWHQVMFDYGRAWFEQETGRWRQFWLSLTSPGNLSQKAPALAGMMGIDIPPPDVLGVWEITAPDMSVEIKIVVTPILPDQEECGVEVALTLRDHLGDFSGVQITLLWDDAAYTQKSDILGKVSFRGLPCRPLPVMSLQVLLPPK